MLYPDWVVIWLAIAGGCILLILGARRLGLLLAMPALMLFVVFPISAPTLFQGADVPILMLLVIVPIVVIFGGIFLLESLVRPIYGHTAAGYVAGYYLVRVFDLIGRGVIFLLRLPFRLLRRLTQK